MRLVIRALRPALALFVIAHGLAHAVLPLRGSTHPDQLQTDFMPLFLYAVAVLGFASAGVGILGVSPFTATVRPGLVLPAVSTLVRGS